MNRLTGRDEKNPNSYGLIFCKKCERTWPWCRRHANLPKSLCRTSKSSAPAPAWVKKFDQPDAVNTEIPHPQPNTIDKENPESPVQPRRRIRGKIKIDTNPNANSVPETAHVSPTASHVSHFASSSGGPALPRAGIGLCTAVLSLYAQWLLQAPTTSGIQQAWNVFNVLSNGNTAFRNR